MTTRVVQEKFQVNYPLSEAEDVHQGWTTDAEARSKKNTPGREGRPGGDVNSRYMNNAVMTLSLPPGADLEDQEFVDCREMGVNIAGNYPTELAKGDVTQDLNPTSARFGFDKKKLLQTDDEYTREHNDAFYDDVGGFVERNNMLDRM